MNSLDLHGIKHSEVPAKVDSFLYEHMKRGTYQVEIITGFSQKMKEIVMEVCEEYGFSCKESWYTGGSLTIDLR